MPSANGRSRIDCDFVAHADEGGAIVCGMKVQGDFSPRGLRNYGSGQVNDFQVTLPQVLVNPQSLGLLRERLVEWQVNPSSFSLELGVSSGSDQRLTFAIGQDDKLIYSVAKPACILTYTGGSSMLGRWAFLVDQSCIRLCADGIGLFLTLIQPRTS
jgi:hypothetical protein